MLFKLDIESAEKYFADFETSYINKEQLLIGESSTVDGRREMTKRERYVNIGGIMHINDDDVTLFQNGKDTLNDFMNFIFDKAKEHYYNAKKNKEKNYKRVLVYFHNLDYDFSYIEYYLSKYHNGLKPETGAISYKEMRDDIGLYACKVIINLEMNKKLVKKIDNKKHQKYNEDGSEMKSYHNIEIYFLDTYKIFPSSLEKLAEAIGGIKETDKYDYKKVRDYNYRLTEDELTYIKGDVLNLRNFYVQAPDYSKRKLTLASNCMQRFKDVTFPIEIEDYSWTFDQLFLQTKSDKFHKFSTFLENGKTNEYQKYNWNDLCKNYHHGYTGGITQVNEMHQGKYIINEAYHDKNNLIDKLEKKKIPYMLTDRKEVIIDVNSLYPSIMYNSKIPFGAPRVYSFPSEKFIRSQLKDKVVFCIIRDVNGYIKPNKMPIIPKGKFLKSSGDRYYTQLNDNTFCVNYDEFLLWEKHYDIYDGYYIEECLVFDSVRNTIFKNYIDEFYELKKVSRANGDKVNEISAKNFLNSLYGRFGLNPNRSHREIFYDMQTDDWSAKINEQYYYIDDNGDKIYADKNLNGDFIYPFLASAITSYARIFLVNAIDKIPYDKFLYCDTDSIHFIDNDVYGLQHFIDDNLISKDEMLKFSIEDYTDCSVYLAPKKYAYIKFNTKTNEFEVKIACAGLPKEARDNITDISNFYFGLKTVDKLAKSRCKGGIDLTNTLYQIKAPSNIKYEYVKDNNAILI